MADDNVENVDQIENESDDEEVIINFDRMGVREPTPPPAQRDRGDGPNIPARDNAWGKPVKIENFTGDNQPWPVWRRMFERIATLNGWQNELPNRLFAHLRGQALEVACGLPDRKLEDYESLVEVLERQFGPTKQKQLHLAELRNKVKKPTESYRELGREIKRLCALAYPDMDYEARQPYAKMHFCEAISEIEIRLLILQSNTTTLEDAMQMAEELTGYRKCIKDETEKQGKNRNRLVNAVTAESSLAESLKHNADNMKKMQDVLEKVLNNQEEEKKKKTPTRPRCWNCGQIGHLRGDCPMPVAPPQGNFYGPRMRGAPRS